MLPIDAHVHFHSPQRVPETLRAAVRHFRAAAAPPSPLVGVLLLAQTRSERVFEWLRGQAEVDRWKVQPAEKESCSLSLDDGANRLLVVCGRQISTEDGLEVLALGTDSLFEDGLGLERTVENVRAAEALPVLPWGFGKWTGRRGKRLRRYLASQDPSECWLGDNGGRMRGIGRPALLSEAEERGARILPGTDPFPVGTDYRRVGSFGCLLEGRVDPLEPWGSIQAELHERRSSPSPYGTANGWLRFCIYQARIRLHRGHRETTMR